MIKHIKYIAIILLIQLCSCGNGVDIPMPDDSAAIPTKAYEFTNQLVVLFKKNELVKTFEARYSQDSSMQDATTQTSFSERLELNNLQSSTTYFVQFRVSNGKDHTAWGSIREYRTADLAVSIETYNIMADSAYFSSHGPEYYQEYAIAGRDYWVNRREEFKKIILDPNNFPDVLTLQEVSKYHQLDDIMHLLQDKYEGHINTRDIGKSYYGIDPRAILWKKGKYTLVKAGDFDAYPPHIAGKLTGRYVVYVILKDNATGHEFMVFNQHPNAGSTLQHQEQRNYMANVVSDTAFHYAEQLNIPTISTGDFNNYPQTKIEGLPGGPMIMRARGFTDTYDVALDMKNEEFKTSTRIYENIPDPSPKGANRIDYVFVHSKNKFTVSAYEIVIKFQENSNAERLPKPSDHYPVRAELHFSYE